MAQELIIIGGGLAGSEAAWQASRRGLKIRLYEMRPNKLTSAHKTKFLAELVCSNSFRSNSIYNAVGLLKEEMRMADSLIMRAADRAMLPAGSALAVQRDSFSMMITETIEGDPNIEVIREEVKELPGDGIMGIIIIATGPLTSEAMAGEIARLTGSEYLYFYDAISPIIDAESIDMSNVFRASRYGKGGDDYLNLPMTEEQYDAFYNAMIKAEKVPIRAFEEERVFEGCMPIEIMASRGKNTLRFGPMKPVGLIDPGTKRQPYAVVQLRAENAFFTAYNIVGFQTRLKRAEQKRVFGMIPGLERAEFMRFGSLHRNTYINSPLYLEDTLQFKAYPNILLSGQITGVEGYVESASMGLIAGINAYRLMNEKPLIIPPSTTAHGALIRHITLSDPKNFQPSNINFGLMPPLVERIKDKMERCKRLSERAIMDWEQYLTSIT